MSTVTLHRVPRPSPRAPNRCVWMLRWYDNHSKRRGETIGDAGVIEHGPDGKVIRDRPGKMSKRQADSFRKERQVKFNLGLAKRERPRSVTLAQFLVADREAIKADRERRRQDVLADADPRA